jgi:hypothetical protein
MLIFGKAYPSTLGCALERAQPMLRVVGFADGPPERLAKAPGETDEQYPKDRLQKEEEDCDGPTEVACDTRQ